MNNNIRIGEVLLDYGYITEQQLNQALAYQKENPQKRIGGIMVELGFVSERQMLEALGQRLSLSLLDIGNCDVDVSAVEKIPKQIAVNNNILAFGMKDNMLKVITSDPLNLYGIEEVRQMAGMNLDIYLSEKEPLTGAINYYYSEVTARQAAKTANIAGADREEVETVYVDEGDDDAPIIKLVQSLLIRGYNTGASDIHIEPFEDKTTVRMRVDGTIVDYITLQSSIHQSVIARIKIMSNLDIAERRVPQDGHFKTKIDGDNVNIRTSVIPTVFGEKVVMRILATKSAIDHVNHFGMDDEAYRRFLPMLSSPNGIIYITGPTGSGKSTTLYMVLENLAARNVNISTIEDPVEKNVPRVSQVQVNIQAGVTFDIGLRALLRQDPDIIMVGETRDAETASISVRAAITGHLVLSTLHTNDAVSSVIRLMDMGVENYLIANSVIGLVAQRLMKKVCPVCGKEVETTEAERAFLGANVRAVKQAVGCPSCNNTGYNGRIAVHEIALIDKGMREMISAGATQAQLTDYAVQVQKMKTLRQGAMELVISGITTMEELVKVAYHNI